MTAKEQSLASLIYELSVLRKHDQYHPDMNVDEIIRQHFPGNIADFTLSMSELTASFYGIILQKAATLSGKNFPEAFSEAVMITLGKNKAQQIIEQLPGLPGDARGILQVIIAAIFSSSPEFNFQVKKYESEQVCFTISGEDRYHRVVSRLKFPSYLNWPVIVPFIQSVRDVIAPDFTVTTSKIHLDDTSKCEYEFIIQRKMLPEEVTATIQTGMKPPFFRLPGTPLMTCGKFLEMEIGSASEFHCNNFSNLIQLCISGEAWNANRLNATGGSQYMLGDKFRSFRAGQFDNTTKFKAVIESILVKKRKRKSIICVFNETGELIYKLIFDYYMWSEDEFKRKFGSLKRTFTVSTTELSELPQISRQHFTDPYKYQSIISSFNEIHCLGHFEQYPCVPALLLYKILALESEKWLQELLLPEISSRPVLDSLVILSNLIMPIDTPYTVYTTVSRMSNRIFKFINIITGISNPELIYSSVEYDFEL